MKEISLQLYSIRNPLAEDFQGSMDKVAKMGYTGVEFAGNYGGMTAKDLKAFLAEKNLKPVGSHTPVDKLTQNLEEEIAFHQELGMKYMICPWSDMDTVEKAKRLAETLNAVGEKVTKAGLVFGYHNHNHELKNDGGKFPLDVFYELTDPQFVKAEIDIYWVTHAGLDPMEYLKKYDGRLPLVHLKQMKDLSSKAGCDADDGFIDFRKAIDISTALETKEYVYEQEGEEHQLESAEKSAKYLLTI